jgi:manganese/zinc/iron transport system permease protein
MLGVINDGVIGFFSFLMIRLFQFLTFQIPAQALQTEDLQFMALVLSGCLCVLLGFYLVYTKLTMLANSLSHTVLLGLVLTVLISKNFLSHVELESLGFHYQLIAAVITTLLTLLGMKFLSGYLSNEASNAFSFTAFFALAILLASQYFKNSHIGIESVMGNLEAIDIEDIRKLLLAFFIVAGCLMLVKSRLDLCCFDSLFAGTLGIKSSFYKNFLILISALGLMVCFRSLGVILILTLLTAPILTARLFAEKRGPLFILAFMFVVLQSSLTLIITEAFFQYFDLPVSTAGVFSVMGLFGYLAGLAIKNRAAFLKKSYPVVKVT